MDGSSSKLDSWMAQFRSSRDEHAFAQLAAALLRPAKAVALQLLGNSSAAEDAVQEAFLRLVQNRNSYDPRRPFAPWFYSILRNVCLDVLRRGVRQPLVLSDAAAGNGVPDVREAGQAGARELLEMLPERERDVLELRVVHSLAFGDIASALGISEEAAKKRAQRGLRRLQERLDDGGTPPRATACPEMALAHVEK